jgi:hypothetical protein
MGQAFSCPHCGASLEYGGSGRTMQCPYCGTRLDVPEEFWRAVETAETASQWKKYIILFLILTVGLPTCLGLLGTVLGIGGGILAAILPFVLRIFIH